MMQEPSSTPSSPTRQGQRSFFWPGFAMGFALLAILACGTLTLILGFDDISLADLQDGGVLWTPPVFTATPAGDIQASDLQPPVASTPPAGSFAIGLHVRNATSSRTTRPPSG